MDVGMEILEAVELACLRVFLYSCLSFFGWVGHGARELVEAVSSATAESGQEVEDLTVWRVEPRLDFHSLIRARARGMFFLL